MNVVVCDKCGKTQTDAAATVSLSLVRVGQPSELHLCPSCLSKLLDWMREREEENENDNNS